MKKISFGLATIIAIVLFEAFGSVGAPARSSVSTHVASMHAVLPNGTLVDVTVVPRSNRADTRTVKPTT